MTASVITLGSITLQAAMACGAVQQRQHAGTRLRRHVQIGCHLLVAGVSDGPRQPKGLETAVDMIFGSAAATIAAFGLKVLHTCPLFSTCANLSALQSHQTSLQCQGQRAFAVACRGQEGRLWR